MSLSVVGAIIESARLGWTSPVIVGLLAAAVAGVAGILGYEPSTPLPAVLSVYLLFGVFLGTVNPPITNTAVAGMPRSMAGVAASLASTGRQAGTTLGVAISGTVIGPALARGGTAFTSAAHGVWWLVLGLGAGLVALAIWSTGRRAASTASRAAALFEQVDRGTAPAVTKAAVLLSLLAPGRALAIPVCSRGEAAPAYLTDRVQPGP